MATFSQYSSKHFLDLQDELRSALRASTSLEEAARVAVNIVYAAFSDSIVLVRFFTTARYSILPPDVQGRVQGIHSFEERKNALRTDPLVLTLVGTRGVEDSWNSRRESVGHAGIALLSAKSVEAIPMVAALLRALGVDLNWFDQRSMKFVEQKMVGGPASLFYVSDARTTVDSKGRHIIPAREFVATYGIKTVFGVGGVYPDGTILTLIVFTREEIAKAEVEPYVRLISSIKAATASLVQNHTFFA